MATLVVGASGTTGQLLVEQLLNRGESVKIIVRSLDTLSETIKNHENVSITLASILELSDSELAQHVKGCDSVASCLGHNMNFKGLFGRPHWLVTDATRRLCNAIKMNEPDNSVKFVLMNSSGNSNRDIVEKISFSQKCVIGLLRLLVPLHVDNEKAADYLRSEIGQHDHIIEWTAVRPDGLVNENEVTEYSSHPSPTKSAIFEAGTVSRINVAHFMAKLITNNHTWFKWKGQMPVIYSK